MSSILLGDLSVTHPIFLQDLLARVLSGFASLAPSQCYVCMEYVILILAFEDSLLTTYT